MKCTMSKCFLLTCLAIGMLLLVDPTTGLSQQKKKAPARGTSKIISLTDDASSEWLLREARVGILMQSDKKYTISDLPKEMQGGAILIRSNSSGVG
jgi:hypothetical protein